MSQPFVWFHNHSVRPPESVAFYEKLLGWTAGGGPPGMTTFGGATGPFAGLGATDETVTGWVPFAEVESVDAATRDAVALGAVVVAAKTRGPAGEFTVVRDPGGAALALWQKA